MCFGTKMHLSRAPNQAGWMYRPVQLAVCQTLTTSPFLCYLSLLPLLGKQINVDEIVLGLEELVDVRPRTPRRFGTGSVAPNLFREAFKNEQHVFAAEGIKLHSDTATHLGHPDRTPANTLNQYPVEVLAIDEDTVGRPPHDRYWVRWMERCTPENKPSGASGRHRASKQGMETTVSMLGLRSPFLVLARA